jgi:O-antigen/teichoic acid export membrane protein
MLLGFLMEPSRAAEAVAVFSISANLALVLVVFPGAISSIFFPLISRLYGKGAFQQMGALANTAQRWALFLTIPVAAVMAVFSGDLLAALYWESYVGGAAAMSIIVLALLIRSLSDTFSLSLSATRSIAPQLKVMLVSGMVAIAMSILLIPILGMLGSAMALLSGFALATVLLRRQTMKILGFGFAPGIWKILLAGILSCSLLFLARYYSSPWISLDIYQSKLIHLAYLAAMGAFSFLLFHLFAIIFKCLKKNDLAVLEKGLKKIGVPKMIAAPIQKIMSLGLERGSA